MGKNELDKIRELYASSEDTLVKLPSGEIKFYDLAEYCEVVDFFAERYGLGGCKSIEEFTEMVNNLDPIFLNVLRAVAIDRENKKWGGSETGNDGDLSSTLPKMRGKGQMSKFGHNVKGFGPSAPVPSIKPSTPPVKIGGSRGKMRQFLAEWGAPRDKLEEACHRIDGRKIELRDFSHIDSYELRRMSDAEFKKLMADMKEQQALSENFNVSIETLKGRR